MNICQGKFSFYMSILKSDEKREESNCRYTFHYDNPIAGEGRFIHTYMSDGNPLPSFEGEPQRVEIKGDINEFTNSVWNALNPENKVSLFTRFIEIETGKFCSKIINKNVK
jgi:hypothetical protein